MPVGETPPRGRDPAVSQFHRETNKQGKSDNSSLRWTRILWFATNHQNHKSAVDSEWWR